MTFSVYMKIRAAKRRLIRELYSGERPDILGILDKYHYNLWHHQEKFYLRLYFRRPYLFKNRCAYLLFISVAAHIMARVPESQKRRNYDMKDVEGIQETIQFPVVPSGHKGKIQTQLVRFKPVGEVSRIISTVRENLPQDLIERVDMYEHSSMVADKNRLISGLGVLGLRPAYPFNFYLWFMMFVRTCLHAPHKNNIPLRAQAEGLSEKAQANVLPEKSAAGELGVTLFTNNKINKRNCQHISMFINKRDELLIGAPPEIPHLGFQKSEVIKKGKDVRFVQISGAANVLIDTLTIGWGSVKNLADGIFIGVSMTTGRFKQGLIVWYSVALRHMDISWEQFLDWLEEQWMDEADKTKWESSTNATDGLNYLVDELLHCPQLRPTKRRLYQRALADYVNPAIAVGKQKKFHAPWRIASGTQRTSRGNSKRHSSMNKCFCDWVELHDFKLGHKNCHCYICDDNQFREHPDFGKEYPKLYLDLRRHAWILGDDYLCVGYHSAFYAQFVDHCFGTTTTMTNKRMFGQPSLQESEGAEFLRMTFVRRGNNVYTAKNPSRVLAKLFLGESTKSVENWAAALLSARHEVGFNPELQELLMKISDMVEFDDVEKFAEARDKFVKKYPELAEQPGIMLHHWHDIVNKSQQIEQDFVEVLKSRMSWIKQKVY